MIPCRALASALLIAAVVAGPAAQAESEKAYRIGILSLWRRASEEVLRRAVRDLGYVEGGNTSFDARYAEGRANELPKLAAELVRLTPKVIVVFGTPAALAAKQATPTIPIVLWGVGDPVG